MIKTILWPTDLSRNSLKSAKHVVRLVQGDAASEILKAIQVESADLVVITIHGRGHDEVDQKSPVFGSVAEKVVHSAPVPVHLVNPYKD